MTVGFQHSKLKTKHGVLVKQVKILKQVRAR